VRLNSHEMDLSHVNLVFFWAPILSLSSSCSANWSTMFTLYVWCTIGRTMLSHTYSSFELVTKGHKRDQFYLAYLSIVVRLFKRQMSKPTLSSAVLKKWYQKKSVTIKWYRVWYLNAKNKIFQPLHALDCFINTSTHDVSTYTHTHTL